MNSEQNQIFQDFVQESLQQTLPELKLARVADPEHGDPIQWLDPIHVSIMRFQGDGMQGNSVFACDLSFLQKTCPYYDPNDPQHLQILQDWIGELSNLIVGRLKNKLLPFGVVLKLNPPSVTEGTGKIFDLYATHPHSFKLWFRSEKDYVCLAFSLDVKENIDLHRSSSRDDNHLQPGDAIYRLSDVQSKSFDMVSQVRSGVGFDEDQLGGDDFDFVDDVVEPERLHQSRAEDNAPAWMQKTASPLENSTSTYLKSSEWIKAVPTEAARVESKSSREDKETLLETTRHPAIEKRRALLGMEWQQNGELMLRFQGGVAYSLVPLKLLDAGWATISVEGFQFQLQRTPHGVRVSVGELQMSVEQNAAA